VIPGKLSVEVEIGEGNNALVWHPFPGFLSDAKGSWPAVVYPKDPPPVPSAESARYLVCSLHQGQLKVVEIVIFSKDGKVYAKQGSARVQDGISPFNGDLKVLANSEFSSMSPSYDLKVNDLAYEEASTVARVGVNVFLEIRVAYVETFCENEPAQKALEDAIAELTKVPGATAKMDKCNAKTIHSRRLDSVQANVEDVFTVFMPADEVDSGNRQLMGSSLSDLTEAVRSRTETPMQITSAMTPEGNLGGVAAPQVAAPWPGTGSMPGALGAAIQQGHRGAIHSLLGKYSMDWNLASGGSGVGLLATVSGLVVLIAAVVKQRWAGEQASDLVQQGDSPLAGEE